MKNEEVTSIARNLAIILRKEYTGWFVVGVRDLFEGVSLLVYYQKDKLINVPKTYCGFPVTVKPTERPTTLTLTEEDEIKNGIKGTCQVCGRVVKVRIPHGKFHPGNGTVRITFIHSNRNDRRCPGSRSPAREWNL